MSRRKLEPGERVVLASHNAGKLEEIRARLARHDIALLSTTEFSIDEPEENGTTFATNAMIKADNAMKKSGLPALADDSGLEVAGLNGEPGIHSARWAGAARDFAMAMRMVIARLEDRFGSFDRADKRAAFVATLCLAWPDGHREFFEGRVDGTLIATPRGTGGFGYDPIFVPDGETRTFAEMNRNEKAALSHRTRALHQLITECVTIPA